MGDLQGWEKEFVIEGGPKDDARKQLGSLPLLLVQLLALWW